MSKGPGYVERGIEALMRERPHDTFTVTDFARHIYRTESVTKAQRVVISRALRHVFERNPDWTRTAVSRGTRRNHLFGPGGKEALIYKRRARGSIDQGLNRKI
jgi:hypothetical protein